MEKEVWRGGNMLNPLPAVLVTCGTFEKPEDAARAGVLTVAWTGTACSDPPMTYVSVRPERWSHAMIRDTGEFVINLVDRKLVRACDLCGVLSGRDGSKFEKAGITPVKASKVAAPILDESPVSLECKVTQVLSLGTHDMFLGEVVAVDVAKELLDEKGRFRLEAADLITYLHGQYFSLGEELGRFGFSVKKS